MRKIILSIVVLAAILLPANRIMAQATVTTAGAANIVAPIALEETSSLSFGTMSVLSVTPGTCILSTSGLRTQTAGVNLSSATPISKNAAYNVTGAVSTAYAVNLPASFDVINGSESMTVDALKVKTTSSGVDGLTGTLSATGTDNFTLGGTLNVKAAQIAKLYTGSFDVTVAYN